MEQLEMDMKNTDDFLCKNGYGELSGMSPRIEIRFGRLMMDWVSRKNEDGKYIDKLFNPKLPKPTNSPSGIADQALSMPHTQRRDLVMRLAEKNGITVTDLVAASDIKSKRASHILCEQKSRGYLRVFGCVEGKFGKKVSVYVLTDKGRELLGRIGG